MANIADIQNEFIREEIEEFIERPEEIERTVGVFAKARPAMQDIAAALIEGENDTVDRLTAAALEDGIEALEIMDDGLIAGMGVVGIKFRENFIFVPEVLACARAMKAGMVHIEPILSASGVEPLGRVIMGTVKGDLHDIGKNLCIMMLRGAGFVVIDLGVDTSADEFIDAIEEHEASLMGMSALLTTTMPNMGKTIEAFIDADLRDDVKIMVGGAPVTQEFADDMGADGYGKDALACVELAKNLLSAEVEA
ncbi:MAG: corrinoid protein [Acidobacteriota bacterium]|nr:corrinoid protein [Acidobacteriota bacterium]MDE2962887.1 corrinoid protein [Acidobacteriota bacterium]